MNTCKLLNVANTLGIDVFDFKTRKKKAFIYNNEIVIDFSRTENDREAKMLLSEEIGHIEMKAFYLLADCINPMQQMNIEKAERKATNFSYTLQVPLYELKSYIKKGLTDNEISEALDIDLNILQDAVDYYKRKNLI